MTTINPYLETMNSNSDDELFNIILNQDRDDSPLLYDAAVITALNRELITDYQAKGLMEGDTSVLDYNPNTLDNKPEDYKIEKIKETKSFKFEEHKILWGISLIGFGALMFYLVHIDFFYFRTSKMISGGILIFLGIIVMIIGIAERWRR
ncbi:MAG: hypothetical protein AB7S48_00310 [Bacteroidales bacterium]